MAVKTTPGSLRYNDKIAAAESTASEADALTIEARIRESHDESKTAAKDALTASQQAALAAEQARLAAEASAGASEAAASTATDAVTRLELLEAIGGLAPGDVSDATVASLVTRTSTQTRTAAESVSVVDAKINASRIEEAHTDALGADVLRMTPASAVSSWVPHSTAAVAPAVGPAGRGGTPGIVMSGTKSESIASGWEATGPGMRWQMEVVYKSVGTGATPTRAIIQWRSGTAALNANAGRLPDTQDRWARFTVAATVPANAASVRVLLVGASGEQMAHVEQVTLRRVGAVTRRLGLVGTAERPVAPTRWSQLPGRVLTKADMDAAFPSMGSQGGINTIYWPSIIRTDGIAGAKGRYYLYWSTNHSTGDGGIGMAYADHPAGPWTCLGPDPVFIHTTATSKQTETPHVIVRGPGDLVMLFHNLHFEAGTRRQAFQRTDYATSSDGITWTYGGPSMVYPADLPGDPHTGYARAYPVGTGYVGYSLASGGVYSRQGIWYSNDGTRYRLDRRTFNNTADVAGDNSKGVDSKFVPFMWGGRKWAAVVVTGQPHVGPLREDMRGFDGPLHPIQGGWLPETIVETDDGEIWSMRINSTNTSTGVDAARLEV